MIISAARPPAPSSYPAAVGIAKTHRAPLLISTIEVGAGCGTFGSRNAVEVTDPLRSLVTDVVSAHWSAPSAVCVAYVGAAVVGDQILSRSSHHSGRVLFDSCSANDDFGDVFQRLDFYSLAFSCFGVGLIRRPLEGQSVRQSVVAHGEVV